MEPKAPNDGSRPMFVSKRVVGAHDSLEQVIVTDNPITASRPLPVPVRDAHAVERPRTPTGKSSIHWDDGVNPVVLPRAFKTPRGYMSPYVDQNGSPIQRSLRRAMPPVESTRTFLIEGPLAGNDVPPNYERFYQELRAENPYPNPQFRPLGRPLGPRPMHKRSEYDRSFSSPDLASATDHNEPNIGSAGPKLRGKRSRDAMQRTNTMAGRDAAREREIREAHHRQAPQEDVNDDGSFEDDSDGDSTPKASILNRHLYTQKVVLDSMDLDGVQY
ncbi:hypothetical protein BN1708_011440, partial [Verticillium longisporum]